MYVDVEITNMYNNPKPNKSWLIRLDWIFISFEYLFFFSYRPDWF